jgi:Lon protease-like protein
MNLLQPSRPLSTRTEEVQSHLATAPIGLMSQDARPPEENVPSTLRAHEDARSLVRLLQCLQCSRPYRTPVTLPCGRSLCRQCLPQPHEREHFTYPDIPGRRQAYQCPFPECGEEHPASDSSIDVTLTKVMESVAEVVARHASIISMPPTKMEEVVRWDEGVSLLPVAEKATIHEVTGGRLIATYTLAAQGKLNHHVDLDYQTESGASEGERALDINVLAELLESTHREVDCQVCYNLMLDPVTTPCGHTLCRKCLARTLDHSPHCPVCRRGVTIPQSLQSQPSNKALVDLLNGLCPETVAARAEAVAQEESPGTRELDTPLFVCTLGFPNQPTFLRIFEPRYRLMLRRCLEGNGEFGMLMYNRYYEPQGDLGAVHFYHYGTMLRIMHSQTLPDGTSLIESRGTYRFRVRAHGLLDGYAVGNIERLEDVALAEEERIEAEEISRPPAEENDTAGQIDRTPTRDLLAMGQEFISRMQGRSAPWLQQRVLDIHGQPPDDAAMFPYWFASVLPISDEEKYKLMGTTTVRQRLKITANWIRRIESQRW